MNLRYDLRTAEESGVHEHPQKVMKNLGISYSRAVPQTLGDCWFFYQCVNAPADLPPYLAYIDGNAQ